LKIRLIQPGTQAPVTPPNAYISFRINKPTTNPKSTCYTQIRRTTHMSSKNRIEAGRRNGLLAKGKKSEESRQRCAMNSVRHGITAKSIVLSNESKQDFEELRKIYYTRFQPTDEVECDLVEDMVSARWRLRRAASLERVTVDLRQDRMMQIPPEDREYAGEPPEVVRIMLAYDKEFNDSDTLRLVARYETRLQRAFERADAGLRRLQKERRTQEESEAPEPEAGVPNESKHPAETPKEPRTLVRVIPNKIVKMPKPQAKPDPKPTPEEPTSPVTPPRE
jgi:hypothetical protein